MDYGNDILRLLQDVPDGLSIRKIVRHVYNSHNSLFQTVDLEEVKRNVTQYVISRSKTKASPIEHTGRRGVYRINPYYRSNVMHELAFKDHEYEEASDEREKIVAEDTPDMFAGMY